MNKKLNKMPYAQAHVEISDNGTITLVSYTTPVIIIDAEGWITVNGLYSRTTIRHIGAFMQEYTPFDYFEAKAAYKEGYRINMNTGEIKFLSE